MDGETQAVFGDLSGKAAMTLIPLSHRNTNLYEKQDDKSWLCFVLVPFEPRVNVWWLSTIHVNGALHSFGKTF